MGDDIDGVKSPLRKSVQLKECICELKLPLPVIGRVIGEGQFTAQQVDRKGSAIARNGITNGQIILSCFRQIERAAPEVDAARTGKIVNELRCVVQKDGRAARHIENTCIAENVFRLERKRAVLDKRRTRVVIRFTGLGLEDDGLSVLGVEGNVAVTGHSSVQNQILSRPRGIGVDHKILVARRKQIDVGQLVLETETGRFVVDK